MDLVTQVVLGAVVGQFGYQRTLGRKAIGYGALAGLLPDLDIIVKLSSNPYAEMLYHRGITHSLFFAVFAGSLAGYILYKSYGRTYPLRSWIGLMIAGLVTHPLLDFFTVYGTQLLAPFSDHRFALSAIPIIDPLYTVPLIISIVVGLVYHHRLTLSHVFSGIILFCTTVYLFIGLAMNEHVDRHVRKVFSEQHIEPKRLNVYTTMLQLPLRRVVAHVDHDVWVGFASALHLNEKIHFEKIKNAPHSLTKEFIKTDDYKIFKWFANDDIFISSAHNNDGTYTLIVHDLRYGFMHDETTFGLWGLKVTVDRDGKILSPIEKAGINRTKLVERLKHAPLLWYAAFDGPVNTSEKKE